MKLIIKEKLDNTAANELETKIYKLVAEYNELISFEQVDAWFHAYSDSNREKNTWFKRIQEIKPGFYRLGDIVSKFEIFKNIKD